MKNLILSLLVSMLTACGGAEFTGEELSPSLAGEAGEAPVAMAGSGSSVGGSASTGGSSVATGGSSAGQHAGGKGSSAGAAPAACEFDPALLVEAMPKTLVWQDMIATNAEACVTCRKSPCETINVISWGVPNLQQDGSYTFYPNIDWPMISLSTGVNDGMCTMVEQCGSKLTALTVVVFVQNGKIVQAKTGAVFQENDCTGRAGLGSSMWRPDLERELSDAVSGLEFGCAE